MAAVQQQRSATTQSNERWAMDDSCTAATMVSHLAAVIDCHTRLSATSSRCGPFSMNAL